MRFLRRETTTPGVTTAAGTPKELPETKGKRAVTQCTPTPPEGEVNKAFTSYLTHWNEVFTGMGVGAKPKERTEGAAKLRPEKAAEAAKAKSMKPLLALHASLKKADTQPNLPKKFAHTVQALKAFTKNANWLNEGEKAKIDDKFLAIEKDLGTLKGKNNTTDAKRIGVNLLEIQKTLHSEAQRMGADFKTKAENSPKTDDAKKTIEAEMDKAFDESHPMGAYAFNGLSIGFMIGCVGWLLAAVGIIATAPVGIITGALLGFIGGLSTWGFFCLQNSEKIYSATDIEPKLYAAQAEHFEKLTAALETMINELEKGLKTNFPAQVAKGASPDPSKGL
jgi:F0F1-type ATP synthase assembly protein I